MDLHKYLYGPVFLYWGPMVSLIAVITTVLQSRRYTRFGVRVFGGVVAEVKRVSKYGDDLYHPVVEFTTKDGEVMIAEPQAGEVGSEQNPIRR